MQHYKKCILCKRKHPRCVKLLEIIHVHVSSMHDNTKHVFDIICEHVGNVKCYVRAHILRCVGLAMSNMFHSGDIYLQLYARQRLQINICNVLIRSRSVNTH